MVCKIPCEYSAGGDRQAVDWLKKKISSETILVESLINITPKDDLENVMQRTAESIK